jgi:hypothetical protein
MGDDTRACKAGRHCLHPAGPVQPEAHFLSSAGGRLWQYCATCRAHKAAIRARYRQRRQARYRPAPAGPPADSVADIDPAYAGRLNRWLLGLVIRRDGHPLTRDIGQASSGSAAGGARKCVIAYCTNVHRTKYKLCPACREVNRLRCRDRRARLRSKNGQPTDFI